MIRFHRPKIELMVMGGGVAGRIWEGIMEGGGTVTKKGGMDPAARQSVAVVRL